MLSLLCLALSAAPNSQPAQAARAWRESHERAIVDEFFELLRIPNLASDTANIRRNAEAIAKIMEKRGVKSRLLETPGAPAAVYGEIRTPGARRTIVFYAHYDGQPLDPKEWATPPWQPVLRDKPLDRDGKIIPLPEGRFDPESRIYARSASDDKAPIIAMMSALDALHTAQIPLQSNVRFIFEGEEEAGSTHLGTIIAANKDLLSGDVWLICVRAAGSRLSLARAASRPWILPSTVRRTSCTADITAIGRLTPRRCWRACSLP